MCSEEKDSKEVVIRPESIKEVLVTITLGMAAMIAIWRIVTYLE